MEHDGQGSYVQGYGDKGMSRFFERFPRQHASWYRPVSHSRAWESSPKLWCWEALDDVGLSVWSICTSSGGDLRLPLITVGQKLLLVVEELLASLRGVFSVRGWWYTLVRHQKPLTYIIQLQTHFQQ